MAFKYNGTNVNTAQISGPTGYIAEGSPIFQNGILYNINNQNYFKTAEEFNTNLNFSIIVKYKLLADGNLTYFIGNTNGFKFYSTSTNANNLGGMIRASSEDEWTYLNVPTISHQADTWYILQFDYNGTNTYTVTVKNESGTVLGTSTTTSNIKIAAGNICFGYNGGSAAEEIDFNNTYIYINNKLWFWQPKEANYVQTGSQANSKLVWANPHLYLEGPQTYTKVGDDINITDNVASNFTTTSFINISSATLINVADITELVIKIKIPPSALGLGVYSNILFSSFQLFTYSNTNNCYVGINIPTFGDIGFSNLNVDEDYWLKYTNDGTTATTFTSTDGTNWTQNNQKSSTSISSTFQNMFMGIRWSGDTGRPPFWGSIDLNETYIKVNDALWFYGRNYATQNIAPVPTNYSYGTTTTTGIGFVDTRTQKFTELPSGVLLGNDNISYIFPYNLPIQF